MSKIYNCQQTIGCQKKGYQKPPQGGLLIYTPFYDTYPEREKMIARKQYLTSHEKATNND